MDVPMTRESRQAIISDLEKLRDSRLVCYVTGDRQPVHAQIGDDALRPLYDHLRELGHVPKLDLFMYSRGGAIDVPWRIVTALRQASEEWHILVPFRANSAATLVALGADSIVLGKQGELGPIDPIMSLQRVIPQPGGGGAVMQENVSVEDIMAFVRFVRERGGLSDQTALTKSLLKLMERLDAVNIGNAYRTHSHIRDVARRLLLSRREPASEQAMSAIVETLAERVYAHGHAIGLKDAEQIGLPVELAATEVERQMWNLLLAYEEDLALLQPIDPVTAVASQDNYREEGVIAVVESSWAAHEFRGTIEVTAKRQCHPT
jgi:hypothetical protein